MKKQNIVRNIGLITIPVCLVFFGIGWLIFRNLIAAGVLPVIFFTASLYSNIGRYRLDIKRDEAGFTRYRFKTANVYELVAPDDSVTPSLCVEIENDKYLLLNGQWLYSEDTYGEEAKIYFDDESGIFNCYHKPYSFPATEFELWESNLDHRPRRIVVLGDYLKPNEVKWQTPEKYRNKRFAIIDRKDLKMD